MLRGAAKISELVRWNTRKERHYVRTLSFDTTPEARRRLGEIQGFISARTSPQTGDALAANIEDAFNRGIQEALVRYPSDTRHETLFEGAVARVNNAATMLCSTRGLPVAADTVCGVLICQKEAEVTAAIWGQPSLIIFRRGLRGGSHFINVLEDDYADPERMRERSQQGFVYIVSGRVGNRDRMLVSNQNVRTLLGDEILSDILTQEDSQRVSEGLREMLLSLHDKISLAALLIDPVHDTQVALKTGNGAGATRRTGVQRPATAPEKSLERLLQTKSQTNEVLAPGVMKTVGDATLALMSGVKDAAVSAGRAVRAKIQEHHDGSTMPEKAASEVIMAEEVEHILDETPERPVGTEDGGVTPSENARPLAADQPVPALGDTVSKNDHRTRRWLAAAVSVVRQDPARSPRRLFRGGLKNVIGALNRLSGGRKAALVVALSFVLILNSTIGMMKFARYRESVSASYDQSVVAVRQKIDSAEASMIYKDEARASRLLKEVVSSIALLPENDPQQKEEKQRLLDQVERRMADLRHASALAPPDIIANIVSENGDPILGRIARSNEVVWAAAIDGSIFRIPLSDGVTERMETESSQSAPPIFLAGTQGLLYGYGDSRLWYLSGGKQGTERSLATGDVIPAVTDAETFGSRLYLLDAVHNRILKYGSLSGGYGNAAFYVKDGTDLSDAVSFAIDGAVFVLHGGGQVTRLWQGERTAFDLAEVDPPLTAPVKIRTGPDLDDLFVLERESGRILQYRKETGELVRQFESEDLKMATDFLVDARRQNFLVTADNKILRFAWTEEE